MFFRIFFSLIFMLNLSLLSGCGSELSDVLGTNKMPPDEFTILTKPPLIVPPEYNLRPPAEGEIRPNAQQPNRQLQSILFGQNQTDDFHNIALEYLSNPKTELELHPNSPGYRLILNNVLFPAAKKKKQKT